MKKSSIRKVLVANRGEIAVRIMRACRELGIAVVAVYSDVDRTALHVQLADEAYPLGGVKASESYLNQDKILEIAGTSAVDAIHPGYGFLSENPGFAEKVERAGLSFIGPPSSAIRLLGDKTAARTLARKLGVPTVAGTTDAIQSDAAAIQIAEELGYPVLLKAAAGGGGKGMRVVWSREEFASSLRAARSEAKGAFGDDRVYLEKYVQQPRHVEIQIIGDQSGTVVYLGERDCSVQRRHQKVIEESPSPIMTPELRAQMGESAVRLASSAGYWNAGTVEFLVDPDRNFFFLEVNTRLQVEHPVTEATTGIDLVKEQIRVASGQPLSFSQSQVQPDGHAIECRIYAEDPENNFLPSTGRIVHYAPPEGPCVRVDNGVRRGDTVQVYYDPMLAKVIAWSQSRSDAIQTMLRALQEFRVVGIKTTIPFCTFVLKNAQFQSGNYDTHFVQTQFSPESLTSGPADEEEAAAIVAALLRGSGTLGDQLAATAKRPGSDSQWKQERLRTYRAS
ncbi:MAG: acetyl-CoA carboxylase biotin carboxylase subunit [Ignavibacteria bacterium]|nr:acetyl-CoA carboxylase biotin carboxylase subunit [Ignavibacteria bacterium]